MRRRALTPVRSPTARPRCTWRCWPSASARATKSSPSATPSSPRPTPSAIAARRRCSSTSKPGTCNMDPALIEAGDHAAHARQSSACIRSACRAISARIVEIGRPSRVAGHRGRGLCDRQRNPVGRPVGTDRQAARRHRLLLVSPAQGDHHRRRRHDHDRRIPSSIASSGCGGSTR